MSKFFNFRPNEDKQGKDSGIHIKSPISETSRIESMKHQTAIIAQAKSKSNIDSACGVFRDEVNIVCQSEPKSGIEDNIQKQFDEISKTIESIQCLYYASVETSPMLFNNDQSDKNKHFPGIFKTIENLKESVSNIRKPVETDASQSAGREKPVSATSAVAKETSNKANKTSPQKEAFSYLAKPQTPKASILQETISNIKRKNLLKHNVLYLRKSNCCEQNLETKTSNEVLEKISSVCIEPKDNSIASESSAFQKRKQYDRKLRRRMLKKSNKICSK
ncbi:unnamed protein product [Ceutorhynchus assimilis]|uniref:Uncharacterized protein n=1 Tax=Ceutorhynchus assimilis TaxID=467358 RepID=A0A9N9MDM6_9CUCU|nr:unnamed protein product [Ceutorhynchus assimilis]